MTEIKTEDKKKSVESAIYYLTVKQPFYGTMLQCLNIQYTEMLPTAAITFDSKAESYRIFLNPSFFCSLTLEQRMAVLQHEILHFTNKHLFRLPFMNASEEDRKLYNIAGDMSINQYIQGLPEGCVDVKDWFLDDGKPFPTFQTMETYYDLIKNNPKGTEKAMQKYKPFDEHIWDQLSEEDKQKMLQEAKKLVKRTVEKTVYAGSDLPDSIKDLLEEIDVLSSKLNYKAILKKVIKKTISCSDRESTWKKPNKRYDVYSPGTKIGALPKCAFFIDTSGSISVKEMNEFLGIMSNFLKVGARTCTLSLWHTRLYHKQNYKLKQELKSDVIESGGTDVTDVLKEIKKTNPNLSIILTDGYYDRANVNVNNNEVLWIISKGGNKDHPLKHIGKTILLEYL